MRLMVIVAALVMGSFVARGQDLDDKALSGSHRTLAELGRVAVWPHIGSPPNARVLVTESRSNWQSEMQLFQEAHDAIRKSWPQGAIATPQQLQAVVSEYEDLIRTISSADGYGNALLAHCLRRLDQILLMQYIVTYPSEYTVVDEILKRDRVKLLDCRSVQGMLLEGVDAVPPSGRWRLGDQRDDWDVIFRSPGSSFETERRRTLFGTPGLSKLISAGDVKGVLLRLLPSETIERVSLPGLIEFLRRGGALDDVISGSSEPFLRVMDGVQGQFSWPTMGIRVLGPDLLGEIVLSFRPHIGKDIPFAIAIAE
jgi:hypothetical protein